MKAGLLMEAADAQQKLAEAALKRLDAVTRSLGPSVQQAVSQAVSEAVAEAARAEFAQLRAETQRTAQALQTVRGGLTWNLGLLACVMSVVIAGVLVGGLYLLGGFGKLGQAAAATAPSGLRGDPAVLAEFARRGLQVDVTLCGEARRPCVKVDPKAGGFGPRKEFMIVPAQTPQPVAP